MGNTILRWSALSMFITNLEILSQGDILFFWTWEVSFMGIPSCFHHLPSISPQSSMTVWSPRDHALCSADQKMLEVSCELAFVTYSKCLCLFTLKNHQRALNSKRPAMWFPAVFLLEFLTYNCMQSGTYEWKSHKESATAPPACSSHTMTAVGQYGIYTFGGEGRRLSNWVFSLDPDTFRWSPVNTLGVSPDPSV